MLFPLKYFLLNLVKTFSCLDSNVDYNEAFNYNQLHRQIGLNKKMYKLHSTCTIQQSTFTEC